MVIWADFTLIPERVVKSTAVRVTDFVATTASVATVDLHVGRDEAATLMSRLILIPSAGVKIATPSLQFLGGADRLKSGGRMVSFASSERGIVTARALKLSVLALVHVGDGWHTAPWNERNSNCADETWKS